MKITGYYQPTKRTLDRSKPPKPGSGVPRKELVIKYKHEEK